MITMTDPCALSGSLVIDDPVLGAYTVSIEDDQGNVTVLFNPDAQMVVSV